MPKVIKKKASKKKPIQENEVKGAALRTLGIIRERQKKIIITASVVAGIVILYIAFMLYSSSLTKRAYSLETEAYNYYYGININKDMSEEDRWEKAKELYQKSNDIKTTPTVLFYLGNCYYNLKDYDNAIKQYNIFTDKFRRTKGILPLVYQKLVSAYFKTNQNDKALESIDKLAKVENGIFKDTALIIEARFYESIGESEKALENYRQVFTEFPTSPWSVEASSKVAAEETKHAEETSEETSEEPELEKEEMLFELPQEPAVK